MGSSLFLCADQSVLVPAHNQSDNQAGQNAIGVILVKSLYGKSQVK